MNKSINSKAYWDKRFGSGDWQKMGGHQQTTYFYTLLLKLLPASFKEKFNTEGFRICDVGCAEGDGTYLLSNTFTKANVCGVDISEEAIKHAKKRYESIGFSTKLESKYNLVISSNTLEHFSDPLSHLQELFKHSREYVLILVPFEEYNRIDEHFFTFTYQFFKLKYKDFSLVFVNETESDKRYWDGKQLLLVFQKKVKYEDLTLSSLGLETMLKDKERIILDQKVALKMQEELIEKQEQSLKQKSIFLQQKQKEIESLQQDNISLSNKVTELVSVVESMRLKNRFKNVVKKAIVFDMNDIKKVLKLVLGENNYLRLKNLYNSKQMNIDSHKNLVREINFESEKVLYVFPVIDWSFRIQRPQHLALQFRNNGYKIIYFTTVFHISQKPGYHLKEIDKNIYEVTLFLDEYKNIYKDILTPRNIEFLLMSFLELEKDLFINERVSIIDHPFWFDIARKLSGSFTIYDCMDYHEGFGDDSQYLLELEKRAMTQSDLLVLSSSNLYERFSYLNRNSILVRNGCEFKFFNTQPTEVKERSNKKRIGYYGAISSWFDTLLVKDLALKYVDFEFVLVGAVHECEGIEDLQSLNNVKLIGEIPYTSLTQYLYTFDVCIMPFKVNELTLATNPVKIYEYLAAGKPVVSTSLPEVEMMGNVVYTAKSREEFIEKITIALEEDSEQKQQERMAFSRSNDWRSRYEMIAEKVDEIKRNMPKVSIVIVTYNNLDFTKKCLESMDRFNNYLNCEVIIVDNLSTDGTREYLVEYEKNHPNVKVILHHENSGFAGGNNIGINAATGDFVILLNNDTYVTPNWIQNLLKHFNDEKIMMVGPRTNNIGNEARIEIRYKSLDEMIEKSYGIYYKNVDKQYEMDVLAFFCVVMKRKVIDEVGVLDEVFGIGMFEDDDYCKRVKQAGYRLVCADDVFIHHHLGASFDKNPEWKEKLFQKNKKIFEERYGKWTPHKYRAK